MNYDLENARYLYSQDFTGNVDRSTEYGLISFKGFAISWYAENSRHCREKYVASAFYVQWTGKVGEYSVKRSKYLFVVSISLTHRNKFHEKSWVFELGLHGSTEYKYRIVLLPKRCQTPFCRLPCSKAFCYHTLNVSETDHLGSALACFWIGFEAVQ